MEPGAGCAGVGRFRFRRLLCGLHSLLRGAFREPPEERDFEGAGPLTRIFAFEIVCRCALSSRWRRASSPSCASCSQCSASAVAV
jgi:hypothetical protein